MGLFSGFLSQFSSHLPHFFYDVTRIKNEKYRILKPNLVVPANMSGSNLLFLFYYLWKIFNTILYRIFQNWLKIGSNSSDINRFQSHFGNSLIADIKKLNYISLLHKDNTFRVMNKIYGNCLANNRGFPSECHVEHQTPPPFFWNKFENKWSIG